ncbi:MAG: ClcB-like voltage-gated chloride channel protein [Verrucomicrobiota bacterium]|nr:ClcB-like voltage-gated chloride channel protein [Verrucomicrobiota bacterium]
MNWGILKETVLPFFQRHWERALKVREYIRINEETIHVVLAGIVGIAGGLTNVLFVGLIDLGMRAGLRQSGDLVEIAESLQPWQRLLTPVIGGLVAGLVLFFGLRLMGKQGANNIIEVVIAGDGRLQMRSALVKGVASMISIATGASIGREGSITHLTATFASKGGQLANWPPYRLRLLVACGAASGMAAAYNAPVAGAVFAAQIVLGNFSMHLFAPLVFSSVIATMVSRTFFGIEPFYEVPSYDFTRLGQLPWFLVLGMLSGLLAATFLKMLRHSEQWFIALKVPIYIRLMIGGLVVGILAIFFPQVWGNGYGAINQILHKHPTLVFLFGVLLAKLLATIASVGSGAIGGVFTPTLFLGAALGSLVGALLHSLELTTLPTGAFAIVGMGSVLAATIHAPLLAMIMIFEISLNYSMMPPLMLACVVSTLVSRRLHPESIYTEPLRIKGFAAQQDTHELGAAIQTSVGEIMRERVEPLRDTTSFRAIADRFLTSPYNYLPVVDENQRLLGVVALHDMKEYLGAEHELHSVIAVDIMRPPPACLTPNQKLMDVVPLLLKSELRNVPVVNTLNDFKLVGSISRAEALSLVSETISKKQ